MAGNGPLEVLGYREARDPARPVAMCLASLCLTLASVHVGAVHKTTVWGWRWGNGEMGYVPV